MGKWKKVPAESNGRCERPSVRLLQPTCYLAKRDNNHRIQEASNHQGKTNCSPPPPLSLSLFSLINFNKWWTTPLNPRNTDGLPLHSNKRKILWNRPKHQTSFYPFFLHSFKISFKWVNTYKHVCVYIYIQIYLRSLFWISSWLILLSVSITKNWKEKVITTDSLVSECNKRKRRRDWWLLSITLIDVGEERKERKK